MPILLWPLTSTRHFRPHNGRSLDIFSFPRDGCYENPSRSAVFKILRPAHLAPTTIPVPAPWAGNGGPGPPGESLVPALDEPAVLSKETAVLFKHQLLFIYHCIAKKRRSVSSRLCTAHQSERRRDEVTSFRWELEDPMALRSFTDKLFLMIALVKHFKTPDLK